MPLQPITTKQFIGSAVLVTLAFVFLVVNQGRFAVLFTTPLLIATFVIMPRETSKRPVTRSQLLAVLGVVVATAAFIWWTATHPTPESDAWSRSLLDFFSSPIVAVPLWLGFLFLGYRRWRVKPPPSDAPTHGHE